VLHEQEEAGCWCRVVEGIEAEVDAACFTEKEVLELLEGSFWVLPARVPMHALQARPADDFVLLRPMLLHPAAAQAEDDALTRAMLVIVSVSVSPSCLLKGCVQRVRMRLAAE